MSILAILISGVITTIICLAILKISHIMAMAISKRIKAKADRPKIDISNMSDEEIDNYFNSL